MKLTAQEEQSLWDRWWVSEIQGVDFTISELNREREAAENRHEQKLMELRGRCWSKWGGAAGAFGHWLENVPLHAPVKPVWEARPQFGDNWYVKDQFNNVAAENIICESLANQIAEMLNNQEAK